MAITAGGIALMVQPPLAVRNELWILGGVGAAAGVWFLANRHGQWRGGVDSVKADSENLLTTGDKKLRSRRLGARWLKNE